MDPAILDPARARTDAPLLLDLVGRTLRDLQADAQVTHRVALDDTLDRDLGLDSLARVELLLRIERAYGIDLPEDTLQSAESVRDLLRAIERAMPRATPVTARTSAAVAEPVPRAPGPDAGGNAREIEAPVHATTLLEALAWHETAHPDRTQITVLGDDRHEQISYGALAAGARKVATALQRAGLEPRQNVALMLPTAPEYFSCFFGILMAGGVPVPIYPPTRPAQLEEHVLRHAGILANAQVVLLITATEAKTVAHLLQARVPGLRRVVTPRQLGAGPLPSMETDASAARHALAASPITADDTAFLQYTSGSTGNPKGVVLTHANLLANIRAMQQALNATSRDVFISWLPLYHDMGLIGAVLATLYIGMPLFVMSPLAFLARPQRWLHAIHRHGGTISAGPNFAYALCLKRLDDTALAGLDLSTWRLALNGAEPVSPDTVTHFAERFARFGLRREAIMPVYGLAEGSLGVLFPPPNRGPLIDRIQREAFAREHRAVPAVPDDATAQRFVACGRALPGHSFRIVDESGRDVGERVEGRLEFKGPSATQGYFRNPAETARLFDDGWLDTGDRAYCAAGDVYLTGRVKDIVIRGGRNIYPQEIEDAVGAVEGVRRGCVAVFGSPDPRTGTERLVVLAETREREHAAQVRLRAAVSRAVRAALGDPPDEVVLAPPHTVLKTSSGKVRRAASRALFEGGRVGVVQRHVRWQIVRLGFGAITLSVRRAVGTASRLGYACYALLLFALLAPATWLATVLLTRRPATAWRVGGSVARLLLHLTGIELRVHGLGNLLRDRACVLASNHGSYLDGLVLLAALPRQYAFVAKRELRTQFFAGRYLARLGTQFVERFDVKRSVEDANRMTALVDHGSSLLVFPEGTFVNRPGLLPFHLGAFLAAASAGAPVVPVTLRGTRDVLPPDSWWPRRGAIDVDIGAPLAPPPRDQMELFAAAVRLRAATRATIETSLKQSAAAAQR
jgi:acyl carrier protein